MKRTNFLVTSIMSILLLSSTLSAQTISCKNGKCFVDISNLSQPKNIEAKVNVFKNLKNRHFTTDISENTISNETNTIVLEHSKYIMSEDEKNNYLLNHTALYDAEDTIVFLHNKYIMTEKEKKEYYMNERIKEAELEKEVIIPIITVDNKIAKEIILPHSELYCDNSKQATFYPESNYYECV